jgi:hypothetical protein
MVGGSFIGVKKIKPYGLRAGPVAPHIRSVMRSTASLSFALLVLEIAGARFLARGFGRSWILPAIRQRVAALASSGHVKQSAFQSRATRPGASDPAHGRATSSAGR